MPIADVEFVDARSAPRGTPNVEETATDELDTDLVLKPDGLGGVRWGAGGGGVVHETDWVQITDAEFKALQGTPKTLVASGGANIVRLVERWALFFKTVVTAYADGDELFLFTSVQNDFVIPDYISASTVVSAVGTQDGVMVVARAGASVYDPRLVNPPIADQAIQLTCNTDFTGGNAGNLIYAKAWYTEMELP